MDQIQERVHTYVKQTLDVKPTVEELRAAAIRALLQIYAKSRAHYVGDQYAAFGFLAWMVRWVYENPESIAVPDVFDDVYQKTAGYWSDVARLFAYVKKPPTGVAVKTAHSDYVGREHLCKNYLTELNAAGVIIKLHDISIPHGTFRHSDFLDNILIILIPRIQTATTMFEAVAASTT